MAIKTTSQIPATATVTKTSQLPPAATPTKQYAKGTVRPLEPAGHKIARVLMPKTTASVQKVGYAETAKRAVVSGARQVAKGAAYGFSGLGRGASAFVSSPPPALNMSLSMPSWVMGGGYPWQRKPIERHSKRRTKKEKENNGTPDWIRY